MSHRSSWHVVPEHVPVCDSQTEHWERSSMCSGCRFPNGAHEAACLCQVHPKSPLESYPINWLEQHCGSPLTWSPLLPEPEPVQETEPVQEAAPEAEPVPETVENVGILPAGMRTYAFGGMVYDAGEPSNKHRIVQCVRVGSVITMQVVDIDPETFKQFKSSPSFGIPLQLKPEAKRIGFFNCSGIFLRTDKAIVGIRGLNSSVGNDRVCVAKNPKTGQTVASFYVFFTDGRTSIHFINGPPNGAFVADLQEKTATGYATYKVSGTNDLITYDPARLCLECDRSHKYHYYSEDVINFKLPTPEDLGVTFVGDKIGRIQTVGSIQTVVRSTGPYAAVVMPKATDNPNVPDLSELFPEAPKKCFSSCALFRGRIECIQIVQIVQTKRAVKLYFELVTGFDYVPMLVQRPFVATSAGRFYLIDCRSRSVIGVLKRVPAE